MDKVYTIGIDLGGTNTDVGLVTSEGECLEKVNVKTSNYSDAGQFIYDVALAIQGLSRRFEVELQGIGIGAPSGNFLKGTIESAPNLRFKGVVPVKEMLEKLLPYNVSVTNDANAAAYGEMVYGGAKHYSNFMMITIGTGLGSGIVIDRKILYGSDGIAGELGHVTAMPGGRKCSCGRDGCLECYVSIRGIKETYANKVVEAGLPLDDANVDVRIIAQRARENNQQALETFDYTAQIMGRALANAQCYTSPQAYFFMGGIVESGDVLLDPIKKYFKQQKLFIYNDIPILKTSLNKNNAAILGAAAIAVCENNSTTNQKNRQK